MLITKKLLGTAATLTLAAGLSGCVVSIDSSETTRSAVVPAEPQPPRLSEWQDFKPSTQTNVWLGGQPSDNALDAFKARGGTTVINLRTDDEMAFLPYYEDALKARGLTYISLPTTGSGLGGGHDLAVESALASANGPVMLHCASGGRATYAWAMRCIDDGGMTNAEAVAWANEQRGKPWEAGDAKLLEYVPTHTD